MAKHAISAADHGTCRALTSPCSSAPRDRARADTDREQRQHQRHHALVGEEDVLGEHRQSRTTMAPKQPEPGDRENRQQERRPARDVLMTAIVS